MILLFSQKQKTKNSNLKFVIPAQAGISFVIPAQRESSALSFSYLE
ncbi:hypothetical protein ACVWQX_09665 [Neisseria meningitidis]